MIEFTLAIACIIMVLHIGSPYVPTILKNENLYELKHGLPLHELRLIQTAVFIITLCLMFSFVTGVTDVKFYLDVLFSLIINVIVICFFTCLVLLLVPARDLRNLLLSFFYFCLHLSFIYGAYIHYVGENVV